MTLADTGIVVGQLECGDVACLAVDQEPGATLPYPVLLGFFARQLIVEPKDPAHDEAAIRDIVGVPSGPFLDCTVKDQRPDLQRIFSGCRSGRIASLRIRYAANGCEPCAVLP
jgi:hypothetical protein